MIKVSEVEFDETSTVDFESAIFFISELGKMLEDNIPNVRLLVSDGWWMTGQTIPVNGGYTTK